MKNTIRAVASIAVLLALSRGPVLAVDFDRGVDARKELKDLKSSSAQVPQVKPRGVPAREAAAEWTIMYFINAKNNLEEYADTDMDHMEEVGSSEKLNIVVEVGKGEKVRRYLMRKDDSTGTLTSPVLAELGNADMGDWRHLAEYGKWVKANYPAKRYMLSIWNHGSGWSKSAKKFRTKGISYDDATGHHITTQQLAQALAEMGGVDVYASDACLMQMAEVGYELRDQAKVILGSEETEPGEGWNYAYYMGPLAEDPSMGPEQLSRHYLEAFRRSYTAAGLNTTQSGVAATAYKDLVPAVDAWVSAVMQAGEKEVVRQARASAQSYDDRDNIDLLDFVRLVGEKTASAGVKSAGESLAKYVREKLVLGSTTTGDGLKGSSGLAVYMPTGPVSKDYADLAWAKAGKWPAFAAWVAELHREKKPKLSGTSADRPPEVVQ